MQVMFLRCLGVVLMFRVGLSLLSYNKLRRLLPVPVPNRAADPADLQRVAWGVRNAARLVPLASCLTQALAAQFLLARAGHDCVLRIGVAQDESGKFTAHAWLLSADRLVVGGTSASLARYTHLTDLDHKRS